MMKIDPFSNFIALSDSYKYSHYLQYPEGTKYIHSYFESRGGQFPATIFFGLQYMLKRYFVGETFTPDDIEYMKKKCAYHFGNDKLFNEEGWKSLYAKYGGKLPLSIKAVPEGTKVPVSNVLMTVENTDPEFYWLTNFAETILVQNWYPTTVATLSYNCKELIKGFLVQTGDLGGLPFKLHDFGFRGSTSIESAAWGGAAHLVNFMGTDTMIANILLDEYYNCEMAGFSIPASEHSTITSWMKDGEIDAMRNMLIKYPTGLVACVSDSYDIYQACREYWGTVLKDQVMNREGTLVIRPDSGYPPKIVSEILEILGEKFGYTINEKGYKVLDPHVRVIQGDGCNYDMINEILNTMVLNKWSADNIAFGMGGGLLQSVNRDTQEFAFKCSAMRKSDQVVWQDVYKEPVTMSSKNSKRGRLALIKENGEYITIKRSEVYPQEDKLIEVFRDGELLIDHKFDEIRSRVL